MAKNPENVKARQWREAKGLSRAALAELIGYSESMIQDFESGVIRGSGKKIGPREWLRYQLACAAIESEIYFDWSVP